MVAITRLGVVLRKALREASREALALIIRTLLLNLDVSYFLYRLWRTYYFY